MRSTRLVPRTPFSREFVWQAFQTCCFDFVEKLQWENPATVRVQVVKNRTHCIEYPIVPVPPAIMK